MGSIICRIWWCHCSVGTSVQTYLLLCYVYDYRSIRRLVRITRTCCVLVYVQSTRCCIAAVVFQWAYLRKKCCNKGCNTNNPTCNNKNTQQKIEASKWKGNIYQEKYLKQPCMYINMAMSRHNIQICNHVDTFSANLTCFHTNRNSSHHHSCDNQHHHVGISVPSHKQPTLSQRTHFLSVLICGNANHFPGNR